jgi:protein involved in polysaccharide export with SLBB domain
MAVTRPALVAACALTLAACSTAQEITVRQRDPQAFAAWSDAAPGYHLGAGDKVHVGYLLTPEMDEDALVQPDGVLALKIGVRLMAQNLTTGELSGVIERAAQGRLTHPIVTASVTEARAARIVVGGSVARPGVYLLPARASAFEVVMLAGGFQPESRMDEVVVIRQRQGQAPMLRTVNLRHFASAASPADNLALAPEDIIFVPKTRAAEVKQWFEVSLPFTRSLVYDTTSYHP